MEFIIALPKGRLGEDTEKAMLKCGIIKETIPQNSRKLIFQLEKNIQVVLVRAWDVPTYVEMGTADIGICGKDDLMEHDADVFELLDLGFGYCKMVIASKKGISREELFKKPFIKVASKYPNISKKIFSAVSVQAEIIKLYGSVELAAVTGMSDCIVDIVSTGATLRENGLSVLEEIFESTARLIVNRASYYRNYEEVRDLANKLKGVIQDAG
jgi:ATP phosphoribosyltransferase